MKDLYKCISRVSVDVPKHFPPASTGMGIDVQDQDVHLGGLSNCCRTRMEPLKRQPMTQLHREQRSLLIALHWRQVVSMLP